LTNQREANKIGFAVQTGASEINAADSMRGYHCGACHNGKMIFRREAVCGPARPLFFSVKKEIPDGLSVLFSTRDL
jgi:hypothetical protein